MPANINLKLCDLVSQRSYEKAKLNIIPCGMSFRARKMDKKEGESSLGKKSMHETGKYSRTMADQTGNARFVGRSNKLFKY